ncbi:hypothetical protein ABPG77_003310 [Micractinium sp. CCAP 211/92]
MPSGLAGSPLLPFATRFYLHTLAVFRLTSCIGLATLLVGWLILVPLLSPAGHAWFAAQSALFLFASWRFLSGHLPPWHEAHIALLRLNSFGFGVVAHVMRRYLDRAASQDSDGGGLRSPLRLLMLLQLASGASTHLMLALLPLRLGLALPVQLAVVLTCAMHNRLLCASPALSSPGAQHWGHRAFALLDSVCFSLVPQAARLAPEAECAALLTFQQLTISLALPLVVQAAWEAGLYKQHQSQRLTQGLSKECGWQARLYAWIGDVLVTCDALALLAAGWVLVGILWHLAVSLNAAPI